MVYSLLISTYFLERSHPQALPLDSPEFKSNKNEDSKALLKALESANDQESLLYPVRVCSNKSDFILFEEHISDLPTDDKVILLI